jgi:hypothetical protein
MNTRGNERGAAMFVALGFLGAMVILAGAFLGIVRRSMDARRVEQETAVAEELAQAALASGVAHLEAGDTDYKGEKSVSLGDGRYTVEIEKRNGEYIVRGSGETLLDHIVAQRVTLRARVRVQNGRIAEYVETESGP